MKSTGIVRKVDDLGRVVIPIELRRTLGISQKDPLEIYVDTDKIILKKYLPACIFCGNAEELINFNGKSICKDCATVIKNSLESDTPIYANPETVETAFKNAVTNV
ncbi:MAG TPA: AbrB/MazE/SpoVT family DNA-binding domain-containing protein [Thermoanaerobacterales bacterium]|uniref:AbrB/MazE/SpoVT family DNA-binding domain-containing protein n=1 Tax=Tepidanaerobacter sp. GT38 TaxID=2722793 RepID=UPI00178F688D|nr:AbrB/MazE/SpoVT family DNA-binding domain-containing protein [Tepidanaerobacter sp. GT38]MCG1011815.1 AbrB/MazE/SpoVT family DNA-binding domain-containing protein [Tepidanaerobacter sp. GT38]HHY41677.1 AbrB/MazE/SpoVT family DNA-binding domain-containing protein [Thermoanaerobacterales bacterium]